MAYVYKNTPVGRPFAGSKKELAHEIIDQLAARSIHKTNQARFVSEVCGVTFLTARQYVHKRVGKGYTGQITEIPDDIKEKYNRVET